MNHFDTGLPFEELAGEMKNRPVTGGAEIELARFALCVSDQSFTDFTGTDGCVASTIVADAASVMGAKSFAVSYASLL